MSDRSALLEARAAVVAHRRLQADAETAVGRWLRGKRGVPSHLLYRDDGSPRDRELLALHARVDREQANVQWCRALVVACAEAVKGEPFETVVARNAENRPQMADAMDRARRLVEGD